MDTIWLAAIAGDDCPDMLRRFTDTIALCEGRLLDQHLAGMDGMISGLLRIQLPRLHADYAWQRLEGFSGNGLRILSRQQLTPPVAEEPVVTLDISAPFSPGLDLDIRQILDSHGLDIGEFKQQISEDRDRTNRRLQIRLTARETRPLNQPRLKRALSRLTSGLQLDVVMEAKLEPIAVH
ncbi:hypothetical protein GCM10011348_27780 [Marinobacterium nitratireducens]|uniref:Uncharacterized protein n=1 Tax=Marinobacterium nitratireducens TaxID=518897 RepID=A0A917ZKE6_9GAMM|nr:hypothetical protein [Marinobacterium nitratireducens]GGO83604.1 hypothetical protein GCM10011348_27780 [Marinobacterium nitratireducens]